MGIFGRKEEAGGEALMETRCIVAESQSNFLLSVQWQERAEGQRRDGSIDAARPICHGSRYSFRDVVSLLAHHRRNRRSVPPHSHSTLIRQRTTVTSSPIFAAGRAGGHRQALVNRELSLAHSIGHDQAAHGRRLFCGVALPLPRLPLPPRQGRDGCTQARKLWFPLPPRLRIRVHSRGHRRKGLLRGVPSQCRLAPWYLRMFPDPHQPLHCDWLQAGSLLRERQLVQRRRSLRAPVVPARHPRRRGPPCCWRGAGCNAP